VNQITLFDGNERGRGQAARRSEQTREHHTAAREAEWLRVAPTLRQARFFHNVERIAHAMEVIADTRLVRP
jgi:hypothetical protein